MQSQNYFQEVLQELRSVFTIVFQYYDPWTQNFTGQNNTHLNCCFRIFRVQHQNRCHTFVKPFLIILNRNFLVHWQMARFLWNCYIWSAKAFVSTSVWFLLQWHNHSERTDSSGTVYIQQKRIFLDWTGIEVKFLVYIQTYVFNAKCHPPFPH